MFEFFKNFFFLEHKHFINCDLDLLGFFQPQCPQKAFFPPKKSIHCREIKEGQVPSVTSPARGEQEMLGSAKHSREGFSKPSSLSTPAHLRRAREAATSQHSLPGGIGTPRPSRCWVPSPAGTCRGLGRALTQHRIFACLPVVSHLVSLKWSIYFMIPLLWGPTEPCCGCASELRQRTGLGCPSRLSSGAELRACFGTDMVQREMLYFFTAAGGEGSSFM